MTRKHLLLSATVSALLLTGMSQAQAQVSRMYFAGYLGLNVSNDQAFSEITTSNSGDFELDRAPSFAGALGIRLSNQLRMEAELSYRNAGLANVAISGVGSLNTGGEIESTMLFANAYYDFDVPWSVQPFIGAGLGYAWHAGKFSDQTAQLANVSGKDSNFIWNVAAGMKYRMRPDLALTGGYRYMDSFDLEFGSYDLDYSSHEFRLGLEWDLPLR